ncbi:hypothetical protein CK203_059245 [Vitis vinifera]|uniref:Uncharacterized protein n=1 Tax=Vitis vinifera TaxID=29760 RepID=A0A438GEB3_VITVI|nr:hypothetical protein CK203_059245 [Vitis vinifera]
MPSEEPTTGEADALSSSSLSFSHTVHNRVRGALLFRCMVVELCWHFSNFPWFSKVFFANLPPFRLQNGTRVPKVVSQSRNTLRNGALAAKLGIFTLWSFAAVSQLQNTLRNGALPAKMGSSCFGGSQLFRSCKMRVTVLRNGTRVPKSGFIAAKIFAERGLWLRTGFAAKC